MGGREREEEYARKITRGKRKRVTGRDGILLMDDGLTGWLAGWDVSLVHSARVSAGGACCAVRQSGALREGRI
jgi:hypothetical protein